MFQGLVKMKPVKLLFGAAFACGIALSAGTTAANAASYQCPGANPALFNRVYELSTASGCAYGAGNLDNLTQQIVTVIAYQDTYPNPPAPTTGVYPIPAGANLLGTYRDLGSTPTSTGTLVTFTGVAGGTITFSDLFNFINVLVSIQDGTNGPLPDGPRWAVFNLGNVAHGTVLNWDYLTCNNGNPCNLATGAASGLNVWGDATPVGRDGENPPGTPIPGAVWLFGTVLAGGAGFSRWRKRKQTAKAA